MASIGIGFGIENPRFPSIGIGIDFLSIESIGIGIDFGPVRGIDIGIGLVKLVLSVSAENPFSKKLFKHTKCLTSYFYFTELLCVPMGRLLSLCFDKRYLEKTTFRQKNSDDEVYNNAWKFAVY